MAPSRTNRIDRLYAAQNLRHRLEQVALRECQAHLQQAEHARDLLMAALSGDNPTLDPTIAAALGRPGRALQRIADLAAACSRQSEVVLQEAAATRLLALLVDRTAQEHRDRQRRQDFAELIDRLTTPLSERPTQD